MTQLALKLEQDRQIKRVSSHISRHVRDFLRTRLNAAPEFYGGDLAEYVKAATNGKSAPGSADRIMRQMRVAGLVDVELLNRAQSLYRVRWVG